MEQVSVPIRIAFVAVLAIAALWFVALRPKPADDVAAPPPAAPAATGLGTAVEKADAAAATADAANAQVQAATGEPGAAAAADPAPAASSSPAAPVTPAAATKAAKPAAATDPAKALVRQLGRGRAVIVLFVAKGADDRAAKAAVRAVGRRDGRVTVRIASIDDVADFRSVTTGVEVAQAPTTLVIGPRRQARSIVGYTDAAEVRQAVGDVLASQR